VVPIEIKFFATFRDYTKEKQIKWDTPVEDLHDLLQQLAARYGTKFASAVFNEERTELNPQVIVLVNGRRPHQLDGLRTKLSPTDTIVIMPLVAGG